MATIRRTSGRLESGWTTHGQTRISTTVYPGEVVQMYYKQVPTGSHDLTPSGTISKWILPEDVVSDEDGLTEHAPVWGNAERVAETLLALGYIKRSEFQGVSDAIYDAEARNEYLGVEDQPRATASDESEGTR